MASHDAAASSNSFVERRNRWSFFVLTDKSWVWRVLYRDGTDATSAVSFRSADDCTADAALHGYMARKPEDERRRQPDVH